MSEAVKNAPAEINTRLNMADHALDPVGRNSAIFNKYRVSWIPQEAINKFHGETSVTSGISFI